MDIFVSGVIYILGILPDSSGFSSVFIDRAYELGSYMSNINVFFPVDAMIFALTTALTVVVGMYVARWAFYLIALIRGN